MLEKKKNGELKVEGANDVLTMALNTPEHSGRVRAVGGNVNPHVYFNIPKKPRDIITKKELIAMFLKDREGLLERLEILEKKQRGDSPVTPKMVPAGQGLMSDKASCVYEDKAKGVDVEVKKKAADVEVVEVEEVDIAETVKVAALDPSFHYDNLVNTCKNIP